MLKTSAAQPVAEQPRTTVLTPAPRGGRRDAEPILSPSSLPAENLNAVSVMIDGAFCDTDSLPLGQTHFSEEPSDGNDLQSQTDLGWLESVCWR